MNCIEQFVAYSLRECDDPSIAPVSSLKPTKRPRQHIPTGCPGVYLHSSNRDRGEPYYLVRAYDDNKSRVLFYDGPDFFEACCVKKSIPDRRGKGIK